MSDQNATRNEVEPAISSFLHVRGRALEIPVSGTFELTSRCNFNCKMCYIHDNTCNASDELSTSEWLGVLKEAADLGTLFLLLTGGEPLLRSDFEEIYCKAKEAGMIVSVNTNGSLVSGKYLELFRKNPPNRLNISLYGASDETYKALCEREYYEKVIFNLRKIKEAGIPFKLNVTLTPYNICDMEKIHETARELDVNIKTTVYMYPPVRKDKTSSGENKGRFSAREAAYHRIRYDLLHLGEEKFIERSKRLIEGFAEFENECIDQSIDEGENVRCRAGSSSFWLNYKGDMTACGIFSHKPHNVLEEGFSAAWKNLVKETRDIRLPKECLKCPYKSMCCVCAAVCYCETGGFGKLPEYVCEYSKYSAEYAIEEYKRLTGK